MPRCGRVADPIQLRTQHVALRAPDTECVHVHPRFDNNNAERVFADAGPGSGRTGGAPGQVVVIANLGPVV